uniref:Uncharacterized protein n=1 Tax=Rhizophora mucronata TaxID=61149 RepID=A0A2P2QGX3_RHIMU
MAGQNRFQQLLRTTLIFYMYLQSFFHLKSLQNCIGFYLIF